MKFNEIVKFLFPEENPDLNFVLHEKVNVNGLLGHIVDLGQDILTLRLLDGAKVEVLRVEARKIQ